MKYILIAVGFIAFLSLCTYCAVKFNEWGEQQAIKDGKQVKRKRDKDNEMSLGFIRCAYREKKK